MNLYVNISTKKHTTQTYTGMKWWAYQALPGIEKILEYSDQCLQIVTKDCPFMSTNVLSLCPLKKPVLYKTRRNWL